MCLKKKKLLPKQLYHNGNLLHFFLQKISFAQKLVARLHEIRAEDPLKQTIVIGSSWHIFLTVLHLEFNLNINYSYVAVDNIGLL